MIMNQKSVPYIDNKITNTFSSIIGWSEEKSTMAISGIFTKAILTIIWHVQQCLSMKTTDTKCNPLKTQLIKNAYVELIIYSR